MIFFINFFLHEVGVGRSRVEDGERLHEGGEPCASSSMCVMRKKEESLGARGGR